MSNWEVGSAPVCLSTWKETSGPGWKVTMYDLKQGEKKISLFAFIWISESKSWQIQYNM